MATVAQVMLDAPRRIGPRSSGLSMTPAEFARIRVAERHKFHRFELIRGVLIVTPPPGNAEIDPNQELGYLLLLHRDNHPDGHRLDLTLNEQTLFVGENRRRCDRALWIGLGQAPDTEADFPAIIVEFVCGSRRDARRDYVEKRGEYLAAGVLEYWIVDRFRRIMTVDRRDAIDPIIVPADGMYRTDLLPGFDLPLARLLARADLWPAKTRPRRPPAAGDA